MQTHTIEADALFPPPNDRDEYPEPGLAGKAFEAALLDSIRADPEGALFFIRDALSERARQRGRACVDFDTGTFIVVQEPVRPADDERPQLRLCSDGEV